MEYFAGFFDAEGYISLVRAGNFVIGIEQTNEEMAYLLCSTFGGNIYKKSRPKRKTSYDWKIATNREKAFSFIGKIKPFLIVKKSQVQILEEYLSLRRTERKHERINYINKIIQSRIPSPSPREIIDDIEETLIPNKSFYKWLAGFFDGDGCFSCFKTSNKFGCWIGCHSTFQECIIHIQKHINGNITHVNGSKNTVWKWICKGSNIIEFCTNISPHLIIKKRQSILCKRFKESSCVSDKISIISQIQHLNS